MRSQRSTEHSPLAEYSREKRYRGCEALTKTLKIKQRKLILEKSPSGEDEDKEGEKTEVEQKKEDQKKKEEEKS